MLRRGVVYSADMVTTAITHYISASPHCDHVLEDSESIFSNNTLIYDLTLLHHIVSLPAPPSPPFFFSFHFWGLFSAFLFVLSFMSSQQNSEPLL